MEGWADGCREVRLGGYLFHEKADDGLEVMMWFFLLPSWLALYGGTYMPFLFSFLSLLFISTFSFISPLGVFWISQSLLFSLAFCRDSSQNPMPRDGRF